MEGSERRACRHVYLLHIQGQNSNKGTVQTTEKVTRHMEHVVVGFQPFKGVEIWQLIFLHAFFLSFLQFLQSQYVIEVLMLVTELAISQIQ